MSEKLNIAMRDKAVGCGTIYKSGGEGRSPLYTAPPNKQWVGLTDDEVAQAMYRADAIITGPMQFRFAKEIEAKLKDKNHG